MRRRFALQDLPPSYGRAPLPDEYDEGVRLFEQATERYEASDFNAAADGFATAARVFVVRDEHDYANDFRRNRLIALRNATWSLKMVDQDERARQLLDAAAADDATTAPDVRGIAEALLS